MHTLESKRLLLRMFRESDLDAYAEMCGDPEVMRFLGDGQPMPRALAWRSMALVVGHWHLRGFGLWAVEER
jgi:RimJ/RimL family protein N-acetyltransferase